MQLDNVAIEQDRALALDAVMEMVENGEIVLFDVGIALTLKIHQSSSPLRL
jgi:hypothetical protein